MLMGDACGKKQRVQRRRRGLGAAHNVTADDGVAHLPVRAQYDQVGILTRRQAALAGAQPDGPGRSQRRHVDSVGPGDPEPFHQVAQAVQHQLGRPGNGAVGQLGIALLHHGNPAAKAPLECDLLQKALTIHVSQFFRNPSMFDKLRTEVIPGLFSDCIKNGSDTLRASCLGCAGGEEPFSLAILLREHFSKEMRTVQTIIQGTDIDEETLRFAQQAEYIEDRLKEVSAELRERYFRVSGPRFRLVPETRQMVTFLQGDITNTATYVPSNLVLCRNTLIYFNRPDQEKILHGVADSLPAGGVLVLGKSETLVGDVRRRFEAICPVERIYRRINT